MAQTAACPAILVAAPASGQGKTTVTSALARLHTRQGRRVRVFKCGPDFLDPYWHSLASGAPVYQLDLWMTGEVDCRARLFAAAQEADLILVEGVMGLFDGEPSAADLAQRFGLPVLAVLLSMSFSIHSRVRPTSYTELPSAPLSDMKKMKVLSSSPLTLR